MLYIDEIKEIVDKAYLPNKQSSLPSQIVNELSEYVGRENICLAEEQYLSEQLECWSLKSAQINFLNTWGPYDFYITVNGNRYIRSEDFVKQLRKLLKRVNKRLLGRDVHLPVNSSMFDKASVLVGYVAVENRTKDGNYCHVHAHITCKVINSHKVLTIEELREAFTECSEDIKVPNSDTLVFNSLKTTVWPCTDEEGSEERLAKYNIKINEWSEDGPPNVNGPGVYSMFGRKLERLL